MVANVPECTHLVREVATRGHMDRRAFVKRASASAAAGFVAGPLAPGFGGPLAPGLAGPPAPGLAAAENNQGASSSANPRVQHAVVDFRSPKCCEGARK